MDYPQLVRNYLEFCRYRESYKKKGIVDLSSTEWLYPTTMLPLAALIKQDGPQFKYVPPKHKEVWDYFSLITGNPVHGKTDSFIPIIRADRLNGSYLDQIYSLITQGGLHENINVQTAIKYVIGELIANIDEHSKCNDSVFMAQNYTKLGFLEGGFFDNGITIPGSFRDAGLLGKGKSDADCINEAIHGTSTKKDGGRGRGLHSTTGILRDMNSDILIVSGRGAIYINGTNKYVDGDKSYVLDEDSALGGTLISFQVHLPIKEIDIYKSGYL